MHVSRQNRSSRPTGRGSSLNTQALDGPSLEQMLGNNLSDVGNAHASIDHTVRVHAEDHALTSRSQIACLDDLDLFGQTAVSECSTKSCFNIAGACKDGFVIDTDQHMSSS